MKRYSLRVFCKSCEAYLGMYNKQSCLTCLPCWPRAFPRNLLRARHAGKQKSVYATAQQLRVLCYAMSKRVKPNKVSKKGNQDGPKYNTAFQPSETVDKTPKSKNTPLSRIDPHSVGSIRRAPVIILAISENRMRGISSLVSS